MAVHPHSAADGVWITRAEPGAAATAARVSALGFQPVLGPLLRFAPIAADLILEPGEALAFTSLNGVTRAAALTSRREVRVFAVGDATAEAARAAGFPDVVSAKGDVDALSTLINQAAPAGVVHPCARETAGDLVGALREAGIRARKAPVYETVRADVLPETVAAALAEGGIAAVLIHSPKAGQVAAELLAGREADLRGSTFVGLSPACLEALGDLRCKARRAAAHPDEAALLSVLAALGSEVDDGRV